MFALEKACAAAWMWTRSAACHTAREIAADFRGADEAGAAGLRRPSFRNICPGRLHGGAQLVERRARGEIADGLWGCGFESRPPHIFDVGTISPQISTTFSSMTCRPRIVRFAVL